MSSLATPQQQPPAEEANQGNFSWTGSALAPDSVPGPQPQPQLIVAQQQPNVGQSPSEILQQEYDDMENAPSDGIVLPSSYNDDDDDDGNGVGLNNPTPAVVTAASTTTAASSTAAAASAASSTAAASSTSSSTKVTLVVTEGDNENKYEVDKDSLEICDLIYHEIESEDTFYIKSEDIGGGIDTLQHVINFCLSFKGSSFDIDIDMDQKLPPWVDDFIKRVAVNAETYYNLLDVAALLGIKPMLELLCKYVAAQIYNSHPSNIINEITDHTEIVKLISHEVGDISTQPSPSKTMKQCKPTTNKVSDNSSDWMKGVTLNEEVIKTGHMADKPVQAHITIKLKNNKTETINIKTKCSGNGYKNETGLKGGMRYLLDIPTSTAIGWKYSNVPVNITCGGEGEPHQFKDQRGNCVETITVSKQAEGESEQSIPTGIFPLKQNKNITSRSAKHYYAEYLVPTDKEDELKGGIIFNADLLEAVQTEANLLGVFGQKMLLKQITGGINSCIETDYNGVKVIENVNLRGEMRTLVICTQSRSFNNERLTLLGYEHLNWSAHFVPVEYICDRNSKNMTFAKMKSDKIIFQLVRTHVRCQSSSSIFVLILKLCYPVLGPN